MRFGTTAADRVTGFSGTVTAHAMYITGCDQYCLSPPVGENNCFVESKWFDEMRLEQLKSL